jgi:type VI secretion system Hcp family effector
MKALITNERLAIVELLLPEPGAKLISTAGFRIRLTNAAISRVMTTFPDPAMTRIDRPVLQVSFVYESIEWTWVREGLTAEDDWEAPVS